MAAQLDSPEVQAFAQGFPIVLLHAGVTLGLLAGGIALYAALTPHKEMPHIREGNGAAALSFAGAMVALAIPLAQAMAASTSLVEVVLWGLVTVAVQLLAFRLIDMLLKGLPQKVAAGEMPAAILLAAAKIAAALVVAAAVSG